MEHIGHKLQKENGCSFETYHVSNTYRVLRFSQLLHIGNGNNFQDLNRVYIYQQQHSQTYVAKSS